MGVARSKISRGRNNGVSEVKFDPSPNNLFSSLEDTDLSLLGPQSRFGDKLLTV